MSEFVRLGDHVSITKGRPPAQIPFDGIGAALYLTPEYLRGRAAAIMAKPGRDAVTVSDGDAVLLWDGSNAGEFFHGKAGLAASTMARLEPSERFHRGYFVHTLKQLEPALKSKTNGTGIPHVDREVLEAFKVFCPNPVEQVQIAQILDTLDTTIHQTEAIIEKLKQVKQGLLHDLLTRGIDANGELRPPQSKAPHLYKESLLGWIPRKWSVQRLDQLLSIDDPAMRSGPFGSALLKSELVESGVPLLGIDNVHVEKFVADFTRFVSEKKFSELGRYAVRPGDLMITIMGTVGRCCIVPIDVGRAISSKHTWTITLDQSKYSPLLAMLQINYSPWVLGQFAKDEQGGIMSAIRSETLRGLNLPVPLIEEQVEMAARLQAVSWRLDTELAVAQKLQLEKLGFMDDLLTGRVRVTRLLNPDENPA